MIRIVLDNGMTHEFANNVGEDDQAVEWFKTAESHHVITLDANNGTWHVQKRHIVHIEVTL